MNSYTCDRMDSIIELEILLQAPQFGHVFNDHTANSIQRIASPCTYGVIRTTDHRAVVSIKLVF